MAHCMDLHLHESMCFYFGPCCHIDFSIFNVLQLNGYTSESKLSEMDVVCIREMADVCNTELRAFYVLLLAGQFREVS